MENQTPITMAKLQLLYPGAPNDVLQDCIEKAQQHNLDPCSVQMRIYESESQQKWFSKITRYGYRKIAQKQAGYQNHGYLSLYTGDKVSIEGNNIVIQLSNEAPGYKHLVGAIGWLEESGVLHVVRISYADYSRMKHAWDQETGKPDAMLQKEAEVAVIQKAYAKLFWDKEASVLEEEDDVMSGESTRADIISYIKENTSYMKGSPSLPLSKCSLKELQRVVEQIKETKGAQND